jgi:beta-lactamase class D
MKKQTLSLLSIACLGFCTLTIAFTGQSQESPQLAKYFGNNKGCFLLYDLNQDKYVVRYNEEQCKKRLSPFSTFKVPNALIGLDMGILKDENTQYKWDGTQYPIKEWEQDQTLATAMRYSAVWYFQKVASQVGSDAYKQYLHEFNYGNEDISDGLTTFWLKSSLKISAQEQIDFFNRMYRNQLPVSAKSLEIVKKIIVQEKSENTEFSGKTGTAQKEKLGWFVGHLYSNGKEFTFATNIEADSGATGQRAKAITKDLLKELRLYDSTSQNR